MNDEEFPKDVLPFEEEIKKYIDKYVLGEDKEAHVSTSSFYRHYKDKYDVMNDNYKRILVKITIMKMSSLIYLI